jgi:hypothetical protein
MNTLVMIVLNPRFCCTENFLRCLQDHLMEMVPGVPRGAVFTLKELCGRYYWDPLSNWDRMLSGMCMIYLVEHDLVPFVLVPRPGRNPYPLQYRVKESWDI